MGPPSLPSSYSILTDLAIRVQQVLEEALRESYAEEVDVDAESESDQTAAAPEIGGALSTAVAGSSSAHAADEPGSSSATFAEEAEDVRRKPGVVDEISQTDPVGSALDLCLLCATALRPSTRSVTTQTDVVLVEAERETGEVDQLSADSDDFYASIGRSSTPVQISSSLFTPQVHRTDLDTSGDTDSEALNTTDVEMTELELDDDSVADSTFSLSSRGSSDEEDDSGDELQDSGDVDDGGDSDWSEDDGSSWGENATPSQERKYVVFESSLFSLFSRCQECGAAVIHKKRTEIGSMVRVTAECAEGHTTVWESQPSIRHHMPVGKCTLSVNNSILVTL